ncbi:MAG: DUF4160 domain-containing protein [Halobacteriovoraceae bacterium]|nr:DUF4160 domain-containing protein [Halobacteriovoraceae bacterium]
MGKVFWHDHFEVYVFSRDHNPPHCHIYFPKKSNYKGFLKIDLQNFEVIDLEGISKKDFKLIQNFLTEERIKILMDEWERFHGKED